MPVSGMTWAATSPGASSEVLLHELNRLRSELKIKSAAIEEHAVEAATLQKQLRSAQEGAQHTEAQLAAARDRMLSAEGDAQSLRQQLAAAHGERDALRRELDTNEQGALRTHGRDIEALTAKAAAAEDAQIRCRDLESAAAALRRELGQAQQENATLARQVALARGEAEEARAEAGKAGRELGSTSDYLAGVMSELAAAQDSLQSVRRENTGLQEQLARAEGEVARTAKAAAEARAAATAAAKPTAVEGGAAASAQAALAQAMQQLSLRTGEVQQLKKQLAAAQAAAAAGSVDVATTAAGSGLGTPAVMGLEAASAAGSGSVSPAAGAAAEGGAAASLGNVAPVEVADAAAEAPVADGAPPIATSASPAAGPSADLAAAQQQIADLQRQVAQLRQHLADAAAAAHSDSEESDSDSEGHQRHSEDHQRHSGAHTPRSSQRGLAPLGAAAGATLSPAQQAALERQRNSERGRAGSFWLGGQRPQAQAATTALTQEGLAAIIDKLLASREEQQAAAIARHPARGGASSFGIGAVPGLGGPGPASPLPAAGNDSDDGSACSGGRNDTALWEEATAMLRGELVRLGREAAAKMEENERLRSEVGELKTARFSAEAMATRLEEMNALSIRVASLKLEIAALKGEQDEREDALLGQVAALQAQLARKKKKRRSLGKTLKKAAEGIKKALGDSDTRQPAASPTPGSDPSQVAPAEQQHHSPPAWESLKSRFGSLGRRSSKEEAPVQAATK